MLSLRFSSGHQKEQRQQMSNEKGTHGSSASVALVEKASRISHMRTEDKDVLDNAHHGRDRGRRVISTQIVTLNAVDAGLVPQSGAGNQENVSSVADMLDRDKARISSVQMAPIYQVERENAELDYESERDRELQKRYEKERIKAVREHERMEQERERLRVLARMKLEQDRLRQENTEDTNSGNELSRRQK
ncbi:hypothetical protein RUND412_009948 [Rhizina undulata]